MKSPSPLRVAAAIALLFALLAVPATAQSAASLTYASSTGCGTVDACTQAGYNAIYDAGGENQGLGC